MAIISAKCTTYGRVSTLEETLFSFINQAPEDLKEAEMIIVNDCPFQKLIFEHPNVKIFNLEKTFNTIGEKDNFAIEQGSGSIIATMDDDDIYMPNHLANIKKWFVDGSNMLHWARGVYYNEPNVTDLGWIGNSGMVYSREAWEKVGKHPILNAGGDTVFSNAVHKLGGVVHAMPEEISAFYCWKRSGKDDIGVYHQSGQGFDVEGKPNIIQRHSAHIEKLRALKLIPTGEIILKPHWKYDYEKILKDYITKKPSK